MHISIRPSQPADASQILSVQSIALRVLGTKVYTTDQLEALIEDQDHIRQTMDEFVLVAEVGSSVIGFATLLKENPQIGGVYVHPDFVRHGIGTAMVTLLEQIAVEQRILWLRVMSSLSAVEFYQALGYQTLEETGFKTRTGVWIPCVVLRKRLIPGTQFSVRSRWLLVVVALVIVIVSLGVALQ